MLSLGDIDLSTPSTRSDFSDLEKHLREAIDPCEAMPWLSRAFPGRKLSSIAVPTGFRPARPITLNRYYYPCWGASRFGYGHFLVSSNQAEAVRRVVWGSDGQSPPATQKLTIGADGLSTGDVFDTDVVPLRLTPLGRTRLVTDGVESPGVWGNGLYLLTVVDPRYFWWYKSVPDLGKPGRMTWPDLVGVCSDAIQSLGGPPIEVPTGISPDYLQAGSAITSLSGEVLPPFLDAVMANVGRRLVYDRRGHLFAQAYAEGISNHFQNQLAWGVTAGGERHLGVIDDLVEGGPVYSDIAGTLPDHVEVWFPTVACPDSSCAAPSSGIPSDWYRVSVALSSVFTDAARGVPGSYVVHDTALAAYSGCGSDPPPLNCNPCSGDYSVYDPAAGTCCQPATTGGGGTTGGGTTGGGTGNPCPTGTTQVFNTDGTFTCVPDTPPSSSPCPPGEVELTGVDAGGVPQVYCVSPGPGGGCPAGTILQGDGTCVCPPGSILVNGPGGPICAVTLSGSPPPPPGLDGVSLATMSLPSAASAGTTGGTTTTTGGTTTTTPAPPGCVAAPPLPSGCGGGSSSGPPASPSPSNAAALAALARRIALDYYGWRVYSFDEVYAGAVAYQGDGYTDWCEVRITAEECWTRVMSGPLNAEPEEFQHDGGVCPQAPCCGGLLAVITQAVSALTGTLPKFTAGRGVGTILHVNKDGTIVSTGKSSALYNSLPTPIGITNLPVQLKTIEGLLFIDVAPCSPVPPPVGI